MTGSPSIPARNAARREAALAEGRSLYPLDVVETWPGCTTCALPIRRNVEGPGPGLWRTCGCEGVLWHCTLGTWTRTAAT